MVYWKEIHEENEGKEIEHKVAQLSNFEFSILSLLRLEKKRKPTEIVVFTDVYCFSACAAFVKDMKQNGGAIIVGYGGNPNEKYDDVFDIGESATNNLADTDLDGYEKYEEVTEFRKKLEINMGFSYEETFKRSQNFDETIPREFTIELPDRRIKPLHYESEESIEEFINKGIEIVKNFETNCNKRQFKTSKNEWNM